MLHELGGGRETLWPVLPWGMFRQASSPPIEAVRIRIYAETPHGARRVLSLGTLAFELAFPLAVFVPRSRPFFLVGGVVFPSGDLFMMNVVFIQHLVLYATFIDFEGLAARLRSRGPVPAGHPA